MTRAEIESVFSRRPAPGSYLRCIGRRIGRAPLLAGAAAAVLAAPLPHATAGGEECTAAESIEAIALEGDPAPGTGAAFQTFDRPSLSESGAVCFTADTDGPGAEDDVVYRDETLIAREGDPAPGTEGVFASFEFFETGRQIGVSGDVVFIATLRDLPERADRGVYLNDELIAWKGTEAPMIPGRFYDDFGYAAVTDDRVVGYLADLDGSGSDDSVIFLSGLPLYRQSDAVPGLGETTWDGDFSELQLNGRGDLLFVGNTSLPSDRDVVVYRRALAGPGGALEEIVVQEGQVVPARDGDDSIALFVQVALAETGAWAVRGNLELAPADADAVILTEAGFFAQEGAPVAAMPGARTGNFNGLDMNGLGDVLYLADLEGDTPPGVSEGLFVNGCLVLANGTAAPGLPDGTVFDDLGFEDLAINDRRDIVFAASYTGAVVGDGLFRLRLPAACPADVDRDAMVGLGDLAIVLSGWGACEPPAGCPGDVNADGRVDFADLLAVLSAWGPCP